MPKFDFCFSTTAKIDLQLEFHLGEKEMVENIRVFSLLIVITVEGFLWHARHGNTTTAPKF
jgi:hypothetical protein